MAVTLGVSAILYQPRAGRGARLKVANYDEDTEKTMIHYCEGLRSLKEGIQTGENAQASSYNLELELLFLCLIHLLHTKSAQI